MKKNIQLCWAHPPQTFTSRVFVVIMMVLIHHQHALAQFLDDFSDDDFTNLPTWIGNDSHFTVDFKQLRLQAPEVDGMSYLSTPCNAIQDASWEFKAVLEFNPSSTNYVRIYLASDKVDLSTPLNGYFVMLGDGKDEVSLYKQTGATYSKLIDGRDGLLNASSVTIKIKVTQQNGIWQLFSDVGDEGEYTVEGSMEDNFLFQGSYFGLQCNYTSTRSDKFYFDDFRVAGNILIDADPPTLKNVQVFSSTQLKLTFSEPLDQAVASQIENYSVDNQIGNPDLATVDIDNTSVMLFFKEDFLPNISSLLTITGIKDLNGNSIETTTSRFIFHVPVQPVYKDLVITEIFPDPSPSVGLPEEEFVEIFNRSKNPVNLSGWKLTDQSSTATLPDYVLLPNEYLILTAESDRFPSLSKVMQVPDFPSLNNSSDGLILKDINNFTVDSINYSVEWYKDEEKSKGGWTLELIDPNNLCSEGKNWIASESSNGGSPGEQNSVFANKPDLTGPQLRSVTPLASTIIHLKFDEKIQRQLPRTIDFDITPPTEVINVSFSDPSLTGVKLTLDKEMQPGTLYSITLNNIFDCAGNLIQQDFANADFGLPEEGDSLDILINEILFNPRPTGGDFVEIINNSAKFINLKNWSLANIENGTVKNIEPITPYDFLLKPGDYLALTEKVDVLKGEYSPSQEENFLRVDKLPAFNDDMGSVALIDSSSKLMDLFFYTKDMHSLFIKDEEGVSLERISFAQPSDPGQNWKSASSNVGFATPGYLNSNATPQLSLISEPIKVEPEIFNPINGQPDFTQIHYKFDLGGFVANVKIFDPQGHLIKQLANNDILGTSGFYRWDGDREDGSKVRVGYYMVWFEIFNQHGMTRKFQKRVAIATRF